MSQGLSMAIGGVVDQQSCVIAFQVAPSGRNHKGALVRLRVLWPRAAQYKEVKTWKGTNMKKWNG